LSFQLFASASIFGALRITHSEIDATRKIRISMNHHALYTLYRPSERKMSAQNGPNWFT